MKISLHFAILCFLIVTSFAQTGQSDESQSTHAILTSKSPYERLSDTQKEQINKKLQAFRALDDHQKKNALRRVQKDREGKRSAVQERVNLRRKR